MGEGIGVKGGFGEVEPEAYVGRLKKSVFNFIGSSLTRSERNMGHDLI